MRQEQHVVAALTLAGDDNPGAILVGAHSYDHHMRRLLASPPFPLRGDLARSYEQLAREVPSADASKPKSRLTDSPRIVVKSAR